MWLGLGVGLWGRPKGQACGDRGEPMGARSLPRALARSIVRWCFHLFARSSAGVCARSFFRWLVRSFARPCACSFARSFACSLARSCFPLVFVRPLARSLARSFFGFVHIFSLLSASINPGLVFRFCLGPGCSDLALVPHHTSCPGIGQPATPCICVCLHEYDHKSEFDRPHHPSPCPLQTCLR